MLQLIRSKASSWVIKILFVVLVVSFGIWGIGDILRTKTTEVTVAHVGDQTITAEAFQREYQQQYKRTAAAFGNQFSADLARQLGLPAQVLDQMVSQALFAELANRLGLRAPDDVLTSILATIPAFKNEQGQFDRARFGAYLQQLGMSEDGYIETLRRQLLISQIYGAVAAGANPPQQLVDAIYGYRNEKRIADTVLVSSASMPAPPTPDDATLERYLKEHADRFQAPEYRKLTILRLRPETLATGIKISDDEITQYFNSHKDDFGTPETRHFLIFALPTEAAAKAAADEIARGGDFAAVAKKASGQDAADSGLVGPNGLLPEMAHPAFAAANGAVVGPVRTVLGWQIAKVTKIVPGKPAVLADVRDKIAKQLATQQAAGAIDSLANKLDDTLAGGASLEEAAKTLGLPIENVADVARNGEAPDGKPIGDLIGTPQLLPTAFATETGQLSSVTEDGTGGYFILRVDQVTPPALRSLDQVKAKLLADWQADARDKAAADKAKQIMDRVKAGEDLKTVAQSMGLTVKRSLAFSRSQGDPIADIPASLAGLIFDLKKGEAATSPNEQAANPGHVVAVLVEIQPANPATDPTGVKQLTAEIGQSMGDDLLAQFRKALEQESPVTTDMKAVDSLTGA
jgi:peptidyl-prolyl cis-trans isomerase D